MEMSSADSERRRPWRLFVMILTVVLFGIAVWQLDTGDDATIFAADDAGLLNDSISAIDAVNAFAAFATERRALRDAAADHAYTAEGLRLLAAAFLSISNREGIADPTRYASVGAELLDAAYEIELDERAGTHADVVRAAFVRAGDAVTEIQRARYPQLAKATSDLRDAGRALRTDVPLLKQSEDIQRFFDRASDALRAMAEVGL